MNVSDPVRAGLVASLGRPGGNITGFTTYEPTMAGKWLELLKAVAPYLSKVLILFNPDTAPHHLYMEPLKVGAPSLGLEAVPAPVQTSADIEVALTRIGESREWGMVALPDPFLYVHRDHISYLAARYRVPSVYPYGYHVTNGGLISHGVDQIDQYAQAAAYIDRILRGEKPGDLPVQAPVKFETIINLKAARALGLEVPDTILAQADEVIE
jgi:putative ABC transport system substrate-binding protein